MRVRTFRTVVVVSISMMLASTHIRAQMIEPQIGKLLGNLQQSDPSNLAQERPQKQESTSLSNVHLNTLQPGQVREIGQELPINVVFVGFQRGDGYQQINDARFRQFLPQTSRIANRGRGEWLGNAFQYRFNVVYANRSFENAFFGFINANRHPECVVTFMQDFYNADPARTLNITENSCIDPNITEKWLGDHASSIAVDASQYTVFLINWWGRSDFHFHTYSIWDHPDPDPDTGFSQADFQETETQAWGGITPDDEQNGLGSLRRIWFYDVSAGPDFKTGAFDLSDADLDGDGFLDDRIPPVWEYGNMAGFRPFDDLSGDMSAVVRYIAIDCMFTSNPWGDPVLESRLPTSIQTDITYFNGDPPARGEDLMTPDRALLEWRKVKPFNLLTTHERDIPYTAEHDSVFQCALPYYFGQVTNCYPGRSNSDWDINIYHTDHLTDYLYGNTDHQIMNFVYTLPQADVTGNTGGITFFSTKFTYDFSFANLREFYGNTSTSIHEVGHHLAFDHPHGACDYEQRFCTSAGFFNFLWLGDETDSVMGYMGLSNNFSQFDRDNMDRWMTAININFANRLLTGITASPNLTRYIADLQIADIDAGKALRSYAAMDYRSASGYAKRSYDRVLRVADALGVASIANSTSNKLRSLLPPPDLRDLQTGEPIKPPISIVEDEKYKNPRDLIDPFSELRKNRSIRNPVLANHAPRTFLRAASQ